jgi:hypothetical protein
MMLQLAQCKLWISTTDDCHLADGINRLAPLKSCSKWQPGDFSAQ